MSQSVQVKRSLSLRPHACWFLGGRLCSEETEQKRSFHSTNSSSFSLFVLSPYYFRLPPVFYIHRSLFLFLSNGSVSGNERKKKRKKESGREREKERARAREQTSQVDSVVVIAVVVDLSSADNVGWRGRRVDR